MREIKFRARGKNSNEYLNEGKGLTLKEIQNIYEIELWDFEQYTGLKDKNGKEIYEGDIYSMGDDNIRYKVIFNEGQFIGNQIGNKSLAGLSYWLSNIEVIGNVHKNPELLEVKWKE